MLLGSPVRQMVSLLVIEPEESSLSRKARENGPATLCTKTKRRKTFSVHLLNKTAENWETARGSKKVILRHLIFSLSCFLSFFPPKNIQFLCFRLKCSKCWLPANCFGCFCVSNCLNYLFCFLNIPLQLNLLKGEHRKCGCTMAVNMSVSTLHKVHKSWKGKLNTQTSLEEINTCLLHHCSHEQKD